MAKYVTQTALNAFWTGLKTKLRAKVDVREGYSLTKNDLTDELKAQYDAAYANRVTGVEVNGVVDATKATFDTTTGRVLKITMPTTLQELTNTSGANQYALESSITAINNKIGTISEGQTVAGLIAAAASGKLVMEKVAVLPTGENIQENHIYLVPKATADGQSNVCDEYIVVTGYTAVAEPTGNPSESDYFELVSGSYVASEDTTVNGEKTYYTAALYCERVGDTSVDLSGYLTTSAFNTFKTGDYDVFKASVQEVTVSEIEAMLADDTSAGATDPVPAEP